MKLHFKGTYWIQIASLDDSIHRASIWLEKQDKPCRLTGNCTILEIGLFFFLKRFLFFAVFGIGPNLAHARQALYH